MVYANNMDPQDHIDSYFDNTYLRWFDLQGKPSLVEIVKVDRKVELTLPGGATSKKPVIHIKQIKGHIEAVKPLVLNRSNRDSIVAIYGTSVSAWLGKKIVLFQTERKLRGKMVEAIGVRAKIEQGGK